MTAYGSGALVGGLISAYKDWRKQRLARELGEDTMLWSTKSLKQLRKRRKLAAKGKV